MTITETIICAAAGIIIIVLLVQYLLPKIDLWSPRVPPAYWWWKSVNVIERDKISEIRIKRIFNTNYIDVFAIYDNSENQSSITELSASIIKGTIYKDNQGNCRCHVIFKDVLMEDEGRRGGDNYGNS